MTGGPNTFEVEGLWTFIEPGSAGLTANGAMDFKRVLGWVLDTARAVLAEAGINAEDLARHHLDDLRPRVPQGSAADVALAVYAQASRADSAVSEIAMPGSRTIVEVQQMERRTAGVERVWVPDGWRPEYGSWVPASNPEKEWIEDWEARQLRRSSAVALLIFDVAHRFAVLQTMISTQGTAARGRKNVAALKNAKPARGEQAKRDLMEAYGAVSLKIARRLRDADPAVSKAEIARQVRNLWSEETSRSAEENLPKNDRNIIGFLTKNGF